MKKHAIENITLLCGGQSAEHEISLLSAKNVFAALDAAKYQVLVIYVDRQGRWFLLESPFELDCRREVYLQLGADVAAWVTADQMRYSVDCVFPLIHGTRGEDGNLPGLLSMMNVPCVGSSTLGSAVCMNKPMTKQLLQAAGLPAGRWIAVSSQSAQSLAYDTLAAELGPVLFVKPANLGSSIGLSKVNDCKGFDRALQLACEFDTELIIEAMTPGREIECSVLGNDDPCASKPGEVITNANKYDYYSYAAKYTDTEGARVVTPADLPMSVVSEVQTLAIAAFKALSCRGMARVDFFVDGHNIVINEVNTIPGFTDISLYPANWVASGLSYAQLIERLLELATDDFLKRQRLIQQSVRLTA